MNISGGVKDQPFGYTFFAFFALTGAQEILIFVRLFLRLFVHPSEPSVSKALNLHPFVSESLQEL